MERVIEKHCDPNIEKHFFDPKKTTLSDREISFVYANRDRLRENATKHELIIAKFLDDKDVYFIPQLPVFCRYTRTTFWADFFIPRHKVVIEVDGSSHYTERAMTRDAYRDAEFSCRGITVIRIKNSDVDSGKYVELLADVAERCKCRHHVRRNHGKGPKVENEDCSGANHLHSL